MAHTTTKPGARDAGLQRTFACSKSAATQRPKVNRSRQQDRAERAIASIRIGKRYRRDLGDIAEFARRIASVGLLQPVVITPDGQLIDGQLRLEALKKLGHTHVPVHVVDIDAIVCGELAANVDRKDFTPSELVAITEAVEKRERELARQRMTLGKLSTGSQAGKVRDKIDKVAKPHGMSGRTLEKARAVVRAAQQEPERFGYLREELDRPRGVDRAFRSLRRAQDEHRVLSLQPREGKFRTLVVDPPWAYDMDFLGRGAPKYSLMERDEILALPVAEWAEDDSHLYLWATNAILPFAIECMAAWGFQHKSVLTWVKPRFGLGSYFRGSTEHVLFGVRGKLMTRSTSIATHFEAPVGEHSEKPNKFYEIVRAASYLPAGEAFQRKARPDFVNLFEQRIASEAAQ
jgi:N6-adenosine-specific RNA methylase IME4